MIDDPSGRKELAISAPTSGRLSIRTERWEESDLRRSGAGASNFALHRTGARDARPGR